MSAGEASDPILESFRLMAERAGISFTEEELVRLRPQYAQLLEQVRSLRELDLSAVEPPLAFLPQGMAQVEGR